MVTLDVLGPAPVVRPRPGEGCDFQLCGSIAQLRAYLQPALQDRIPFAADWEATSLNTLLARPAGLSVAMSPRSALYVPLGHFVQPEANLPVPEVVQVLAEADAAGAASLWFNVAYDHELSHMALGWAPVHWHDVLMAVFLVDSNAYELGLKASSLRFFGEPMQELSDLDAQWLQLSKVQRKVTPFKLPHQLAPSVVAPYGCDDAEKTRRLWFHPEVQQAVREQALVLQIEERLSPVLREGNRHGVVLDRERLVALRDEVTLRLAALTADIHAQLGEPVVLSRKAYLGEKLLALGLPIAERTATGKATVNVKVLAKYADAHPVVALLIAHAQLTAQRDNYLVKLLRAYDYFAARPWSHGRVRFAFNAIGVPTGRMKCGGGGKGVEAFAKGVADVNAQSIPDVEKATGYLPNIRSAFIAPEDFVVVAFDYNQIELRITANASGEQGWIDAYLRGADLHLVNAQRIANVKEPGLIVQPDDKRRRGGAKATGFALVYGGDEHTVARNAGLPLAEAKGIVDAFFLANPAIKRWMDSQARLAEGQRRVTTKFGRVRHLGQFFGPEPPRPPRGTPKTDPAQQRWIRWWQDRARGHREAINDPVQGGAADVFKVACRRVADALATQGWGPGIVSPQVLWIHDELVVYVHADWVTRVVPVVQAAMTLTLTDWPVPLTVDVEVGSERLYQAQHPGYTSPLVSPIPWTGRGSSWGTLVPYATWVAAQAADVAVEAA
jgi:DNA polymerase-1